MVRVRVRSYPDEHGARLLGRGRGAHELAHARDAGGDALAAEVAQQATPPEAAVELGELRAMDRHAVAASQRAAAREERGHLVKVRVRVRVRVRVGAMVRVSAREERGHLDVLDVSEAAGDRHEGLACLGPGFGFGFGFG